MEILKTGAEKCIEAPAILGINLLVTGSYIYGQREGLLREDLSSRGQGYSRDLGKS